MKQPPVDRPHLLNAVLADERLESLRATCLSQNLALARRRRQQRHLRRISVWLGIMALTAFATFRSLTNPAPQLSPGAAPSSNRTAPPASRAAPVAPPAVTAGNLEMVDDDELLALFPNRPVALVGRSGEQKLIFLDQLPSANEGVRP